MYGLNEQLRFSCLLAENMRVRTKESVHVKKNYTIRTIAVVSIKCLMITNYSRDQFKTAVKIGTTHEVIR